MRFLLEGVDIQFAKVEAQQDGDEVDIRLNGQLVASFDTGGHLQLYQVDRPSELVGVTLDADGFIKVAK